MLLLQRHKSQLFAITANLPDTPATIYEMCLEFEKVTAKMSYKIDIFHICPLIHR